MIAVVRGRDVPRLAVAAAAFLLLFAWATSLAPHRGALPLLGLAFVAGPGALCCYLAFRRPVATLVALYVGLAPLDFLFVNSHGVTLDRLIGLGALAALSIAIVRTGPRSLVPWSVVAWLVTFAWMLTTLMWTADPAKCQERLMQVGLPICIMTLVAVVPADRKDLRAVLVAIVGIATALSLYAIVAHPATPSYVATSEAKRLWLSNGNQRIDPNGLAFALMTPLAIALAAALSGGRRWLRAAGLANAAVILAAIMATESRGGLLGALALAAWAALRAPGRFRSFTVLGAGLAVTLVRDAAWQRLFSQSGTDAEGAGRLPIWRIGAEAFRQHWLAGSGFGTFSDAYNGAYLLVPHYLDVGWSREAHDLVLSSFVELGVFGGLLVLATWWLQFRQLRAIPRTDPDAWLRLGCEAAIIGVFVTALFLDILELKPAWVAPIVIALIANVRTTAPKHGSVRAADSAFRRTSRASTHDPAA